MAVAERRIRIVGVGPGAPELVTPAARRAVEEADVLVGAARLLALFPSSAATRLPVQRDIAAVLSAIAATAGRQRIAVLVSGDPGLLSLARRVVEQFGSNACEMVPGISSVQVAFARVCVDWGNALIIDAHGRVPCTSVATARGADKIALMLGCSRAEGWLDELAGELRQSHRFVMCQSLTLPDELVCDLDGSQLHRLAAASRTIVLVLRKELFTS